MDFNGLYRLKLKLSVDLTFEFHDVTTQAENNNSVLGSIYRREMVHLV